MYSLARKTRQWFMLVFGVVKNGKDLSHVKECWNNTNPYEAAEIGLWLHNKVHVTMRATILKLICAVPNKFSVVSNKLSKKLTEFLIAWKRFQKIPENTRRTGTVWINFRVKLRICKIPDAKGAHFMARIDFMVGGRKENTPERAPGRHIISNSLE